MGKAQKFKSLFSMEVIENFLTNESNETLGELAGK